MARSSPGCMMLFLCCLASPLRPESPTSYEAAVTHVREGRFGPAISLLETILAKTPADLKARNLLGIAWMSSGRRAEASVQFRQALELNPRFHPALKNLAMNELALGQRAEAKIHFQQAAKLVPEDAVVQFHLGEICFAEERYAEAAAHFHAAQNGFPGPYQVGFNLVLAYFQGGNYPAAARAGEQMLARGEPKAELYNLLARVYAQSGQTQRAYDALRAAAKIDPRDESNYLDLMLLCLEHQNWDLSLEISDVALRFIPQSYKVRLQRGAVLAMQGRPDDAENEFLAATRAAPNVNLPYVALALLRIERSRPAEAIALLRARRAAGAEDYVVSWMLAEAICLEGAPPGTEAEKEAMQALDDALRRNPQAAPARALRAKLLAKRGDLDRAAHEFEEALKLDPDDAAAAYQLALVYRKTGNTRRAEELFAKVGEARAEDPARSARRNLVRIMREGSPSRSPRPHE